MDPAMQADMATYVTKIRPAFANPGVGQLFVKDDGDALISTQTHQQGTQDEGHTVERVMCHGAIMKQRCYVRADLTTTAYKAMNIIERVTGGSSSVQSSQKPPKGKALTASVEIPLLPLSSVGKPLTEDQKTEDRCSLRSWPRTPS